MKARSIMFSAPEVLIPGETISFAARRMRELDVGALPVVTDRTEMRLAGIVTDRDLVMRHLAERHAEDCPVRHAMTARKSSEDFATARPEDTTEYVMDLMAKHRVRRIPVLSQDDRLVGIIALADVVREVGPTAPAEVVKVLEAVSQPSTDRTPTPVG